MVEIDKLLRLNGKTLDDFESMPKIFSNVVDAFDNVLQANELGYDQDEMFMKHVEYFTRLNDGQMTAYNKIVDYVENGLGRMFFVYGYGGTGKTYLWNALSFRF